MRSTVDYYFSPSFILIEIRIRPYFALVAAKTEHVRIISVVADLLTPR